MRIRAAVLLSVAAIVAVACGGKAATQPPLAETNLNGIYSGLATSTSGAEITITVQLQRFGERLEAALRYPQDPQVEAVFGIGSQWGRSFALVMNEHTGSEFYLEGTLSPDGNTLTATIRYPDREEMFTLWALRV